MFCQIVGIPMSVIGRWNKQQKFYLLVSRTIAKGLLVRDKSRYQVIKSIPLNFSCQKILQQL